MKRLLPLTLCFFVTPLLFAQKLETVYLNAGNTATDNWQPGNVRHPHSWSIAEPEPLVDWLLAQTNSKTQ